MKQKHFHEIEDNFEVNDHSIHLIDASFNLLITFFFVWFREKEKKDQSGRLDDEYSIEVVLVETE